MTQTLVDIQPTPNVLLALTRTPIAPLDALCELIDNALDSFRAAEVQGIPLLSRQVLIDVPGQSEVNRGEGLLRIRDSGPGLTRDQIADALRAGYSSKNAFDTLGLFGMGFNIATGKLGRTTRLVSARPDDDFAIQVTLDLPTLIEQGSFEVPSEEIPKPFGLEHGTIVEVRNWWTDGDANSAFARRLAQMSKPLIREQLARRYATLVRGAASDAIKILVNGDQIPTFEHCVWSADRFVDRLGHGRISAYEAFEKELNKSTRCVRDGTLMVSGDACPRCGGVDTREVNEVVRGWVGIQRFDDQNDYGIDLIRNGRAIRIQEKSAFFEHVDENTKRAEKEYPIDQQYGRIVGEVHLDHVPVDFSKQDFQRTTDEWHAAMQFIRGHSLLPSKWEDGYVNETPVSKLFQGYRKVRNFGKADMYMGRFNEAKGKADRISRETEREYFRRFQAREPGYYDDSMWWELVETANDPPLEVLPVCAQCGFQNAPGGEQCEGCGAVLDGKICLNPECSVELPKSAVSCSACGASQVPEILNPWNCVFCASVNEADDETCQTCGLVAGTIHPASREALMNSSEEAPGFSIAGLTVRLANGANSAPVNITTRLVDRPIIPSFGAPPIPACSYKEIGSILVFVDRSHQAFSSLGLRPEDLISAEVAQFLYDNYSNLAGQRGHSPSVLMAEVLQRGFSDSISETPEGTREDIELLFKLLAERLVGLPEAQDFYSDLDADQQRALAASMISSGVDLSDLTRMKDTGEYLRYCEPSTIVTFFRKHPRPWFEGQVWDDPWPNEDLGPAIMEQLQEELSLKYLRCLEDCASYLKYRTPERLLVVRARAAADFLNGKLK